MLFHTALRTRDTAKTLVVLNWSDVPAEFDATGVDTADAEVVLGNDAESPSLSNEREFRPYEAVVYRV